MSDLCESHSSSVPAIMLVTFHPGDRPFRVCVDCALDAVGYGQVVDVKSVKVLEVTKC